ncbi:type II toxin-antitoxin system HicA family toxin [Enterococcus sp. BWR-S5]|uniref:type II toxin-antitoxin system HicA family toxin n=1 Tax=Enterococcus sp. BWR-S5 TaxID=2787714 RepID=UPI0019214C23|nr:type II toxin-antitoxin system HicA family toxin [Enterococcus sp. BWR-S5]MBL1224778.1 type II toxin-antitoxin system HicA family toxin [Enterococcus sp. BWR-S5]
MVKNDKLYDKIKRSPNNTSFIDLKKLLEYYGFIVKNRTGGSHYTVTHPKIDFPIKPLAKHSPVKRPYVKDFLNWIDEVKED